MPINNSTLPSREEYLRRKRKRRNIKIAFVAFVFVASVLVSSFLSHRPQIRVSNISLNGGVLVRQEDVSDKTKNFLSGSYLFLYPRNSSFWYPQKGLEEYLKINFRRIDTIDIYRSGFKTLIINITERKPFGIWCDNMNTSVSTTTDQKCYFLDQNSTIFSEAPYFSGDAYFKYYGSIGTSTPIGNYYMASSSMFDDINTFVDMIRRKSLHPMYLIKKDDGDFSIVISGGGEILFDTKKPISVTAQNLDSLLKTPALSLDANGILPVDYIDLRFGNKLFYKLKGEKI